MTQETAHFILGLLLLGVIGIFDPFDNFPRILFVFMILITTLYITTTFHYIYHNIDYERVLDDHVLC